jgi:Zn-dependent peptidase ImmA (M78 family)
MPKASVLAELLVIQKGDVKIWTDEELAALAAPYGVSREAMLRRLLTLGKTTKAFYDERRPHFLAEYAELEAQKSKGGPEYPIQVLSQLGRSFSRLIFQGYHERRLTLRDVANYLNMQVRLVPEMERATFGIKG